MATQSRKIFYKDETFSLEFDDLGEEALIHMYVNSYTHKSVRKWYLETERLREYLIANGFTRAFTVTPNPRFVKLFNGEHTASFEHEGKLYEVVVWDLKQQP